MSHFSFVRLQTKERENEKERKQNRNDQERESTGAEATDNRHNDNAKDGKREDEASSSFSVLDKDSNTILPCRRVEIILIQGLGLTHKVKVASRLIRIRFKHFLFQDGNACDGRLSWIDQATQSLERKIRWMCERIGLSSSGEPKSRTDQSLRPKPHLSIPHLDRKSVV